MGVGACTHTAVHACCSGVGGDTHVLCADGRLYSCLEIVYFLSLHNSKGSFAVSLANVCLVSGDLDDTAL